MHRIRVNNLVFKVREDDYERITRLLDEGGEIIEEEQEPIIVEDIPQEVIKDKPTKKRKSRKKRK